MHLEKEYYSVADKNKVKEYGQFFTPEKVADFMASWISNDCNTLLDPATGNNIFFRKVKNYNSNVKFKGYEIDPKINEFFSNEFNIEISDYLLSNWDDKYDGIIANPPYNKFQTVKNRKDILKLFKEKTGISFSGYTNQAILFLIKSIYQLNDNGKIAYIIPTDFFDSKYGDQIKEILIKQKLLHAIINFECCVFDNATTTSCILLIKKSKNNAVKLYNIKNIDELNNLSFETDKEINIDDLLTIDKWSTLFKEIKSQKYKNLVSFKTYGNVSRGIATGSNDFFLFNKSKSKEHNINEKYLSNCISKSADLKNKFFTNDELNLLINNDKKVLLLNINNSDIDISLKKYIALGEANKENEKYLLKNRHPWYSMEQKKPSPIWITNANRGKIKVIRNLTNTLNLTTFHSIYVADEEYTDILFCYLLTDIAQEIIKENKKTMGGGLDKYQPSDLNNSLILDFKKINSIDIEKIRFLYQQLLNDSSNKIETELNNIFIKYII